MTDIAISSDFTSFYLGVRIVEENGTNSFLILRVSDESDEKDNDVDSKFEGAMQTEGILNEKSKTFLQYDATIR